MNGKKCTESTENPKTASIMRRLSWNLIFVVFKYGGDDGDDLETGKRRNIQMNEKKYGISQKRLTNAPIELKLAV